MLEEPTWGTIPNYNTYNAIIPLIQKQTKEVKLKCYEFLQRILKTADWLIMFECAPAQLREALLRAKGKWKD